MDNARTNCVFVCLKSFDNCGINQIPKEYESVLRSGKDVGVRTCEAAFDLQTPMLMSVVRRKDTSI